MHDQRVAVAEGRASPVSPASQAAMRGEHLKATLARYWCGPFTYDPEGAIITDTRGNRIVDIRGYGLLTGSGSGAHGLPDEEAVEIQDEIGAMLARFLNGSE